VAGIVMAVAAAFVSPWKFAITAGWCAAGVVLRAWVWISVGSFDPDATRRHATTEDNSRITAQFLLLSASVASLGGAAADLVAAGQTSGSGKVALTIAGVATVLISWGLVHTVFALRYAHEYYTPPIGGIDFKSDDERPDYQDFAYVAFTIGMTFQVSDTDLQNAEYRRIALRHALLSYLFGAVILAATINLISSIAS
jgi:uncharacterized membrane protein